jgi:hypothetical protein
LSSLGHLANFVIQTEESFRSTAVDVEPPITDKCFLVVNGSVGAEEIHSSQSAKSIVSADVEHLALSLNVSIETTIDASIASETSLWDGVVGENGVILSWLTRDRVPEPVKPLVVMVMIMVILRWLRLGLGARLRLRLWARLRLGLGPDHGLLRLRLRLRLWLGLRLGLEILSKSSLSSKLRCSVSKLVWLLLRPRRSIGSTESPSVLCSCCSQQSKSNEN